MTQPKKWRSGRNRPPVTPPNATLHWHRSLAIFAFAIVALLAWSNSFDAGFVFDNHDLLLGQERIQRATLENLARIFTHGYWWPLAENGLYRPVTTLSYLFNYAILGNADHAAGYHAINLLLHAGNVLLVYLIARRLTRDFAASLTIAGIWTVHPVLTESVTNMVGRADLLAGMAVLGGLLIYWKSAETTGATHWKWLAALTVVSTLGVFAKESAVAIAGVIGLYELTWWDRSRLPVFLRGCLAMAPAFVCMWWVRSNVLPAGRAVFPFVDNPIAAADFWTGRLTAIKVMAKYLALLVWPAHLSADYSYAQIPLITGTLADWTAWIAVAATAIIVAFLYRRNRTAFFAAGFALVAFLPTSNLLIPVGTIMAERFLYLPAIGFAVCLTLAVYAVGRRIRPGNLAPLVIGLLLAAGFGARTFARNADWKDDLTMWSAQANAAPLSFKTHVGLAKVMTQAGHFDLSGALREVERSLAFLDPLPDRLNDATVYYRLGGFYINVAQGSSGRDYYERGRKLEIRSLAILHAQNVPGPGLTDRATAACTMLAEADRRLGDNEQTAQYGCK